MISLVSRNLYYPHFLIPGINKYLYNPTLNSSYS